MTVSNVPADGVTVDVQLQAIRNGLVRLSGITAQPTAQEALDVNHSVDIARTLELLRRLQHSLTQYAERGRDLFYIAFVGHFSSGKSSTINSVFKLWSTPQERQVDLNPTDTAITLITDARNEHSLLRVANEGLVPIRTRAIDLDLLSGLVIADTPGTGDPQELQEIARQFLPLCDLVLFFFSAASAFDITDLPLLTELRTRLPFIPIKFVVTRTDEFRRSRQMSLTHENFDDVRANAFVSNIAARLNKAPGLGLALEPRDFFMIDNVERFQIDPLRDFLAAAADQKSSDARIQMHSHKVHFFRTAASECLHILKARLSEQFDDIDRIVTTARRNVERFEECVMPSTLTITKRWNEELQRLADARSTELTGLVSQKSFSLSVASLPHALEPVRKFHEYARHDAQVRAARIAKHVHAESIKEANLCVARIQEEIATVDVTNPEQDFGARWRNKSSADLEISDVQSPSLEQWINEVREGTQNALEAALNETRSNSEALERRLNSGRFLRAVETADAGASEVLFLELDRYFDFVLIYHGSVFARHVKEAIARAGLGRRLDELEHEMSTEQREAAKAEARIRMLGILDQSLSECRKSLIGLGAQATELRKRAAELELGRIPEQKGSARVGGSPEAERLKLSEESSAELSSGVESFASELRNALTAEFLAAQRKFNKEKDELSAARTRKFTILTIGGGVIGLLVYILYTHFRAPADQALGKTILFGALSSMLGNVIGYIWWKSTDGFLKAVRSSARQTSEELKQRLYDMCESRRQNYQPGKVGEEEIAGRLYRLMSIALKDRLDADDQSFGSRALQLLNETRRSYEQIRIDYGSAMEALMRGAAQCLGAPQVTSKNLEEIASEIRKREISPSFQVLDETRERYAGVQRDLDTVTFG